jgi:hypothetical protein
MHALPEFVAVIVLLALVAGAVPAVDVLRVAVVLYVVAAFLVRHVRSGLDDLRVSSSTSARFGDRRPGTL